MANMACLWYIVIGCLIAYAKSQDPGTISFTITDDQSAGWTLGNLTDRSGLTFKYSSTILAKLELTFLNDDDVSKMFVISGGLLQTARVIDRDEFCPNKAVCTLNLDVKVHPVEYFQIIKVVVDVLDSNDHSPTFPSNVVDLSIKESASVGYSLPLPAAADPDSPQFGVQQYRLLTQTDVFDLRVSDNQDGSREVALVLRQQVDREQRDSYRLEVQAQDGGTPPNDGRMIVNIAVLDVNDNTPVFLNNTYNALINEDISPGTAILTVSASDADLAENARVQYSIAESSANAYPGMFRVNSTTGVLYAQGQLDYEKHPVYVLTVEARDSNPDAVSAKTKVTVALRDANDNPPIIKLNLDDPAESIQISENSAIGDFVAHITVADADSGENKKFSCSLDSDLFMLQQLYPTEFKIISATTFDRETKGVYDIYITCSDYGSPVQTTREKLTINILDENDNSPVFESSTYQGSVLENTPGGTLVVQVKASDRDIGVNSKITYSIDEAARALFVIDQQGNITTKSSLDREVISRVRFNVFAVDHGKPVQTGTANVIVNIIDIDDESPTFRQDSYTFAVYENGDGQQEIGQAEAVDRDSELFNQFTYTLKDTLGGLFSISPQTGMISTRMSLDRETTSKYELTVMAVGKGLKALSSSATVTIYVADENDHAPEITFPNAHNNTVSLSPRNSQGHVITKVEATDMDAGVNAQLSYLIISGNDDEYFSLDKQTGILTIAHEMTGIENQAFGLVIQVKDSGDVPKTSEAFLNVIVNKSLAYQGNSDTLVSQQNLKIVIAIACVAGVIMVVLLIAIVAIIRQQRKSPMVPRKYNNMQPVMESHGIAGAERKKKEVSFDNSAMEVDMGDGFTFPKNHKHHNNSPADDTDSACSVDMSNADSGRGSNDEFPAQPAAPEQHHNNDVIPTNGGIPIRTGNLDPGSYHQGQQRDISKLFTRDILYRDNIQGNPDVPPKIPERAPRLSQRQAQRNVYGPNGDVYATPAHMKPRAVRLSSDNSGSSQSSCPVHSPKRDPYGKGQHGHGSGRANGLLPKQMNVPSRHDEVILNGVLENSEITV